MLDLPQFLDTYVDDEYYMDYPIYLVGFNEETGILVQQVTLDYNQATGVFSNPSAPLGIGINKTGYLNLLDYFEVELTPVVAHVSRVV